MQPDNRFEIKSWKSVLRRAEPSFFSWYRISSVSIFSENEADICEYLAEVEIASFADRVIPLIPIAMGFRGIAYRPGYPSSDPGAESWNDGYSRKKVSNGIKDRRGEEHLAEGELFQNG